MKNLTEYKKVVREKTKKELLHWNKMWNSGNLITNLRSKQRHERNLNYFSKYLFISWEGIIFHWWKFWSQNVRHHENWKLIIFKCISVCFSPPFSKLLHSLLWLIFRREEYHINLLSILYLLWMYLVILSVNCNTGMLFF